MPKTYLNMSEIGTKIDPGKNILKLLKYIDYYDYLRQTFINQTCYQNLSLEDNYRMCGCRGNNF